MDNNDGQQAKEETSRIAKWLGKHLITILGLGGLVTTALIATGVAIFIILLAGNSGCSNGQSEDSTTASVEGVSGAWTKKGTTAYANAEAVFMRLGKHFGLGGAGASGAIGSVTMEDGTFDPRRVQGDSYTTNPNPKEITGATGTHGYGLFMVSPGSKYGNWSKAIIPVKNDATSAVNEADYMMLAYGGAATNGGLMHTPAQLKNVRDSKSPADGADQWYWALENHTPGSVDKRTERESGAEKAYELFGGADIKADSSVTGATDAADAGESADANAGADSCSTSTESDAADGTGTHKEPLESSWKNYDDLPADVKKYAHDPAKLLGARGNGAKWKALGVGPVSYDQCVGFTVAYGDSIWGHKGNVMGNGIDQASGWAKETGTLVTKKPKAGAIVSQLGAGGNPAGHTFIIMHVYANGDALICEQNWTKSGQYAGETFTWDFRLVGKQNLVDKHSVYDYPGDNKKYKLKW